MGKKPWTEDEDKILIDNYSSKTMDELLALFPGKTTNSIYGRAYVLRLKKPKSYSSTEERRERIRLYRQEGITYSEIARMENISLSTIRTDVATLGIQGYKQPKPKIDELPESDEDENRRKINEIKERLRQKMARQVIVEKTPIRLKAWERDIIRDFGRSLCLAELKLLLPRRSRRDIIDAGRYFGIEIK